MKSETTLFEIQILNELNLVAKDIPDNCGRDMFKFNKKDDRELFIEKYCTRNQCQKIDKKRKMSEEEEEAEAKKVIIVYVNLLHPLRK